MDIEKELIKNAPAILEILGKLGTEALALLKKLNNPAIPAPGTPAINPQGVAISSMPPDPASNKLEEIWNPVRQPVQGSYRTQDKRDAIDAALVQYGITLAPTVTYPKRHQALLDFIAAGGENAAATPDLLNEVEPAPKPSIGLEYEGVLTKESPAWIAFSTMFMADVKATSVETAVAAVKQITGQENVTPEDCAGKLEEILELTKLRPEKEAKGLLGDIVQTTLGEATQDAVKNEVQGEVQSEVQSEVKSEASQTGEGSHKKALLAAATNLVNAGVDPIDIRTAVAHLAKGITQVPEELAEEALGCIKDLKARA